MNPSSISNPEVMTVSFVMIGCSGAVLYSIPLDLVDFSTTTVSVSPMLKARDGEIESGFRHWTKRL